MPKVLEISNWLYNAGVTGFLEVLKEAYDLTDEQVLGMIQDDGERIVIPDEFLDREKILRAWRILWLYNTGVADSIEFLKETYGFTKEQVLEAIRDSGKTIEIPEDAVNKEDIKKAWNTLIKAQQRIYGTKTSYYCNQKAPDTKIKEFIEGHKDDDNGSKRARNKKEFPCCFCGRTYHMNASDAYFLSQAFSRVLFTAHTTFSNSYWGNEPRDFVCYECAFIIFCHHLAFTILPNKEAIFINTGSFKTMYKINNQIRLLLSTKYKGKVQNIIGSVVDRLIDAVMAFDPCSNDSMSIVKITNFYIPWEVQRLYHLYIRDHYIDILNDARIEKLLRSIGEISIFEKFMQGQFRDFVHIAHNLMHIGAESQMNQERKQEIAESLGIRLYRNHQNLIDVAQKLLSLYFLVLYYEKTKTTNTMTNKTHENGKNRIEETDVMVRLRKRAYLIAKSKDFVSKLKQNWHQILLSLRSESVGDVINRLMTMFGPNSQKELEDAKAIFSGGLSEIMTSENEEEGRNLIRFYMASIYGFSVRQSENETGNAKAS